MGFLTVSNINKRKLVAVTLLNIGTLSWFFIMNFYISDIFRATIPNDPYWGLYIGNSLVYGLAIFWSITISFIGSRINRRHLLFTSIILGVISTALLGLFQGTFFASIVSVLLGTSLGLGLPSSMALVADCTIVDNRGRVSGIIILGTFIITFASMAIIRMLNLDGLSLIPILVVVRSISLVSLAIDKLSKPSTTGDKETSLPVATYREFIFYLCPWLMFTIASSLARSLIVDVIEFESAYDLGTNLRWVFIALFGLAAGFIADRFGRKLPIIFGLATFGVGYILLGFSMNEISIIIYYALSGITWGLFFVIFLVIPGDLSIPRLREKFYALGYILPLTGILALSVIPVPNIREIIDANLIAQILGICLFLSMYPVFRAKETLTERKIREREMKEHAKRIGKLVHET